MDTRTVSGVAEANPPEPAGVIDEAVTTDAAMLAAMVGAQQPILLAVATGPAAATVE